MAYTTDLHAAQSTLAMAVDDEGRSLRWPAGRDAAAIAVLIARNRRRFTASNSAAKAAPVLTDLLENVHINSSTGILHPSLNVLELLASVEITDAASWQAVADKLKLMPKQDLAAVLSKSWSNVLWVQQESASTCSRISEYLQKP